MATVIYHIPMSKELEEKAKQASKFLGHGGSINDLMLSLLESTVAGHEALTEGEQS